MIKLPLRVTHNARKFIIGNKCLKSLYNHEKNSCCRQFQTSCSRARNFWEINRKGGTKYEQEDPLSDYDHVKRGSKMIIPETKKWIGEMKDYFSQDCLGHLYPPDYVTDKYFEFNGPDSLENWVVSCDADFEGGSSTADVSIMSSGTGLFSGNLSTQTPKTGKMNISGYANLRFVPPTKSFHRDFYYVFISYTHLVLRIRGDGRTYMVNLHPHNMFDTSWLDMWSYVLHTRGGPYWQETKIPFTKFFLHHKGRIQDKQYKINLQEIKTFSITLMDQNNGPFSLEIDHVGCMRDPNHAGDPFAYETYRVPRFAGFN